MCWRRCSPHVIFVLVLMLVALTVLVALAVLVVLGAGVVMSGAASADNSQAQKG